MTLTTIVTFLKKTDTEVAALIADNNLQGQVLVSNQCDKDSSYSFDTPKAHVFVLNSTKRGVSLARNTMFQYVKTDLVTFADDDMIFINDYEQIVNDSFVRFPSAVCVRFNIVSLNPSRPQKTVDFTGKLRYRNVTSFGALSTFIKVDYLRKNAVFFNENFGPGTSFVHGEDSIFLHELFVHSKEIYQQIDTVASVRQESSTWEGKSDTDPLVAEGAMFFFMFGWKAKPYGLIHIVRQKMKGMYPKVSCLRKWSLFKSGIKKAKQLR